MGPHSRFDLKYHFVWVTKYHKGGLVGEVGGRLRELVREVSRTHEIEILQGSISRDHVHVLLSCPPNLSPSKVMQDIKGKTSRKLLGEDVAEAADGVPASPEAVLGGVTCGRGDTSWRRAAT